MQMEGAWGVAETARPGGLRGRATGIKGGASARVRGLDLLFPGRVPSVDQVTRLSFLIGIVQGGKRGGSAGVS